MDESAERLEHSLDHPTDSLQRTLTGSPTEGNRGVLVRLATVEKRVERLLDVPVPGVRGDGGRECGRPVARAVDRSVVAAD